MIPDAFKLPPDDSRTVADVVRCHAFGRPGIWIGTDEAPDIICRRLEMGERAETAEPHVSTDDVDALFDEGWAACLDYIRGDQ